MAENKTKKKKTTASPKDKEWKELCAWVELNIFNYGSDQKLQKQACLVLKGLTSGQNVANNNCEKYGEYSYEVILLTFKANKDKILRAINGKDFESERNKMSYVCAIIRDNINDMATRMKNAKKAQEKVNNIDTSVMTYDGAEYQSHTETTKINDKFKDLW